MANEITIVVKGDNRSKPALKEPADDAEKLGVKARKAGDELGGMGTKARKAGDDTDTFGQKASKTDQVLLGLMADFNKVGEGASRYGRTLTDDGNYTKFLEERLSGLRGEAKRLGEELNRTGNVDVFKRLSANQDAQESLKKIKTSVIDVLGDAGQQGGKELGKNLSSSLQGAESTPFLGPAIGGAVAAAVVAGAPLIMAALDGVLLAGIAAAGIGVGIAGQLQSQDVQHAIQSVGDDLQGRLRVDTEPFKGPLVAAVHEVGDDLGHLLDRIDFSKLSAELGPLSRGIGGLLDKMGPGLNEALGEAGPVLGALAQELPGLGSAIGDFFHSLAEGSQGGAEALRTLIQVIGGLIIIVGDVIRVLSDAYTGVTAFADGITGIAARATAGIPVVGVFFDRLHQAWDDIRGGTPTLDGMARSLVEVGTSAALTQSDLDNLAGTLGKTKVTADSLAATMVNKLFSATMNLDQATLSWDESLTRLGESLKQNGRNIDEHTKAGQANREAILAAVTMNERMYQSNVAVNMSATDAAAAYDQNTRSLEAQLHKAHLTQGEIDGLIGKYRSVPDSVNTAIQMHGLTEAINSLDDAIRLANGLDGRVVKLTIEEQHRVERYYPGDAFPGGHASGGIWGGLTWVGERGRELVKLPQGSQVYSHGDSQRMAGNQGSSGASGGGQMTLAFAGGLDDDGSQLVQRWFRTGKIRLIDSTGQPVTVR